MDVSTQNLTQHPLRKQLYGEIHSRPFPQISSSVHATHFAFLTTPSNALEQLEVLTQIALEHNVQQPNLKSNCYYTKLDNYELRWEKHQEFCTLTFIQNVNNEEPFTGEILLAEQSRLLDQIPGELVVALRIHLERDKPQLEPQALEHYFENSQIYGSIIVGDKASMWSGFRLHSDDFARILIYDKGLSDYQAGRTLQRIIEIETYLRLALLALPPARALMPKIAKLSAKLTDIIKKLQPSESESTSENLLLDELSRHAAQIEDYRAVTTHRFSATQAYYQLVGQRLHDLREQTWPGYSSWEKMIQRRLKPAVETCTSVSSQLQNLSAQAERASNLLRTRVDMSIQNTNQELLSSINRRSHLQLRLQQTVEGLSVVAISYYLVSLIKIMLEGVQKYGVAINPKVVAAALTIPVIITIAWLVRRLRKHINKQDS